MLLTCDDASHIGGDDLDADGSLDLGVLDVVVLHAHLSAGWRRQQRTDRGHHWPVHRTVLEKKGHTMSNEKGKKEAKF